MKGSSYVGLGQGGEGCVRVEGTVWNTLKAGGTEKRGGETKILKRGAQAGSRVRRLKKEGGWNPLRTMDS